MSGAHEGGHGPRPRVLVPITISFAVRYVVRTGLLDRLCDFCQRQEPVDPQRGAGGVGVKPRTCTTTGRRVATAARMASRLESTSLLAWTRSTR